MKKLILLLALCFSPFLKAQEKVPCKITLKDGKTISVSHFGHLTCGGRVDKHPYKNYMRVLGVYEGQNLDIRKYSTIRKIELIDFYNSPERGYGSKPEKSIIKFYKKDGNVFTLQKAFLNNNCYGSPDRFNQIRLIVLNPITESRGEILVDIKNIKYIHF
ncbi:hypothetical protein VOI54_17060 [Tamlana sp. 2201CG12-4]|uniref:hypothetical protein n=1 Tax=Tamlana sp. 2201CG12-4 TaxID=3112582 RepID=UPI002DBC66AA|nr:hypothetical protein [Tamlana sp. 2201CG12-4]MEC3908740.1 hypothetical protein [Tamlana sp. 2201CG12-4]